MAVCRIIETGARPDQYDEVRDRLGVGDGLPPGCSIHIAAVGDGGTVRIVEVWDSREQAEAFGEKVRAVREEAGIGDGMPDISYLDVHKAIH